MKLQPEKLLARYRILKCSDLESYHAYIAGMEGRHERRVVVGSEPVEIELRHVSLGRIDVGVQHANVPMTVEASRPLSAAFLVQFPLSGIFHLEVDDAVYTVSSGAGAVISPRQKVCRMAQPGWTLALSLPSHFVRDRMLSRSNRSVQEALTFHPLIGMAAGEIRTYALMMVAAVDCGDVEPGSTLARVLETGLVDLLLMLQPHTFGTSSVGTKMSANMERVQAVTDHIDRNLGEKLRVEQLAEVADCSLRTLQLTIAELFGMTVVEFVRSRRLKEARRLLEAGDAGATVTDIGNRIGLSQLGRFSSDYRATYGESPSETLKMGQTKRARGRIGGSPT